MKLLAIETSSAACSVALQIAGEISEQHLVEDRQHTAVLLPMIRQLLGDAGMAAPDLDAVVLGNGPGSFIGMRIGASVAQGICFAAGLKLLPVSSLAAVAAQVIDEHGAAHIVVAQDARMHEVYIGRFGSDSDGLPIAEGAEEIQRIGPLRGLDGQYVAAGDAWRRYPQLLEHNRERIGEVAAISVPRARYLLSVGGRDFRAGAAIPPEALIPSYIRVKVADKPPAAA